MTLQDTTWIIRYTHTDGEIEEVEHISKAAAEEHFDYCGIEDTDIYQRIELIEYDWRSHSARLLTALNLPAR